MGRTILFIIIVATLSFSQTGAQDKTGHTQTTCLESTSPYMRTDGSQFCFNGERVELFGATFYPYWEHGKTVYRSSAWLQLDFKEYVDRIFELAQDAHLNTLRVTNYLDVNSSWDSSIIWKNIDYFISEAEKRHIWVIFDLSTYRQWLTRHNVKAVYNAENWRNFVKFVTKRYIDASNIAYYSITGEIPATDDGGITATQYVQFFNTVLELIHTGDSGNHLISVGGFLYLNFDSGIPWRALYSLPYNDIVAIHLYSDGDRNITLPTVSQFAQLIGKPFLIEEFGFQQDITDIERAKAFAKTYELAEASQAAGALFWNLGPENVPTSHDVNASQSLVWETIQKTSEKFVAQ
ncbi:MAG: cellulase family glycosylhydrolase [Anaerolineae bacterium]|nr:cellulase family glycosylhydrolase [Anaerolineae bacterium]